MKAGGNRKARIFLESQDDWNDSLPISQKYQSRATALLKDKIMVESQGKETFYCREMTKGGFDYCFETIVIFGIQILLTISLNYYWKYVFQKSYSIEEMWNNKALFTISCPKS